MIHAIFCDVISLKHITVVIELFNQYYIPILLTQNGWKCIRGTSYINTSHTGTK